MAKKSPKSRMMQTSMSNSPVQKSPMVKTSMSKSSMPKSPMPRSPMPNSPMPKSPVIYEKYKSRCAYGFFNLLRRRSKKMIADADRSRISKRAHGDGGIKNRLDLCSDPCIDDEVDKKILAVGFANVKINNIKAEDVSIDQQKKNKITTVKVDHAQSNSELVHDLSRHQRKETKTARKARRLPRYGCYDVSTMGNRNPTDQNWADRSSKSLDAVTAEVLPNQVCPKNEGGSNCKNTNSVQYDQLNEINLQVNMREATETFINQQLIDGKHLCGDGVSRQSQHFLDALDILNSNKDLFIKLLQDPNSLLVKHIEDLRDCQAKHEQSKRKTTTITEDQIGDNTVGNLSKSKETSYCQPLEDIVVLRPNRISHDSPQIHYSLRNVHQSVKPAFFPFEQLKRKLMQTMGIRRKNKQLVLIDGAVDRWSTHDSAGSEGCGKRTGVENFTRNSPDKASSNFGGVTASSIAIKMKDQMDKFSEFDSDSKEEAASASEGGHEKSCLSTLRHLERNKHGKNVEPRINFFDLNNGNALSLIKQKAKTWDGMSLVPEYDFSPMVSPRETREHGPVSPQMRFSAYSSHLMGSDSNWRNQKEKKKSCSSPLRQNLEAPPWTVNKKQQQMYEKISDNLFPDVEEHKSISSLNNNLSQIERKCTDNCEEIRPSEVPCKLDGSHNDDVSQSTEAVDACEQNESLGFSRMDSLVENQTSTSSVGDYTSSPLSSASVEEFDRIKDNAEQPSPISVLDQFYREDTDRPSNIESQPAVPSVRQLQIGSEEGCLAGLEFPLDLNINSSSSTEESRSMLKYVNAVLQARRLEWDELASKCHFSDQLLDQSLFEDVDVWPNESRGDRRLLFNYINEIIADVSQYYLRCSPWLSFIKPRIVSAMITGSVLHEVMKKVDWNLILEPPLQTLEKIIEKDLHSSGTWMDIRIDAEDVVLEMVDSLVEDLTIEVALMSNRL